MYLTKSVILSSAMLVCLSAPRSDAEEPVSPMELIGRLHDADPTARLKAVRTLKKQGPQAKSAVFALIDVLEDDEPLIRIEAARALGAIGPEAKAAVPALIKRLDDDAVVQFERSVWFAAAEALGQIGPAAMPHLLPFLESEDWTRFSPVAEALYHIGPDARQAVPLLLKALKTKSDSETIRNACIYALGGIGPATEAVVPTLASFVQHDNFHTQYFACRALGEIGPDAKLAVPELLDVAVSGNTSVRRHAARALGLIRPDNQDVVTVLVKLLSDQAYAVRVEAAVALGNLGSLGKTALPELVRAAQDNRRRVQVEAARAVWQLTGDAGKVLPVLIEALQDLDTSVQAAKALGDLGVAAKPATQTLQEAMKSQDPETRDAAAAALSRIEAAAADLPRNGVPPSP